QTVAFGSMVGPDGTPENAVDAYLFTAGGSLRRLTSYSGRTVTAGVMTLSLSPDGAKLAYTFMLSAGGGTEEVHLIDLATGADRTLATDTQGCVQPEIICPGINCFFPCVHNPRVASNGSVVYAVSRQQPFYVISPDGSAVNLPVYSGWLAPAPQRFVSSDGHVVFTSSAPAGPTFAAAATNVYLMNLDGTDIRNVTGFSNPSIYSQNAVISADGSTIAFESTYEPSSGGGNQTTRVFVMRSDGSGLRAAASGADSSASPSLSADGSLLAFAQSGQVYLLNTASQNPAAAVTHLRFSTARDPVLSDDGSKIAFTIGPSDGGRGAVYEIASTGGAPAPVFSPVALNNGGVVGVAGTEAPSSGSLVSVYGLNFGDDEMVQAQTLPLPATLGNLSLLVNGRPIPLFSITPWQVSGHLSQSTPAGPATFQVRLTDGTASNKITADVQASAPAVFMYSAPGSQSGTVYWQAAAFHAGTATAADAEHPAAAGERLETYGTGLGQTNPTVAAGVASPASPPARAVVTPSVTIGNQPARVTFAGLVPGLVGVYQINVVVPSGLSSGQQPLVWGQNAGGSIFIR
ncbi:MAG TPA: hypothetical protein VLX58_00130, partial [Bryobacteraceae bacterium]|nr:hypothetical protein [Bryobacteraceae bacterium]